MRLPRRILFVVAALLPLASCSSDPEYKDPEAHEKTELLQARCTPLLLGTWHIEHTAERVRYFERLTFLDDGKLCGTRKCQTRRLETVDGSQRYTDWETPELLNGSFSGIWQLRWERDENGVGHEKIILYAAFDEMDYVAYSCDVLFNLVGEDILRINGLAHSNADGWTEYRKGDAAPSF
ncbi:MAG: hypothetical protein K5945_09875 [Bacteroidaceae bacterium]|nr:hypothetical protein [Bacteroidaceae bacterium]